MTTYVFNETVKKVEEKQRTVSVRKHHGDPTGKATIDEVEILGWFVQLEGSMESRLLGKEKPDLVAGQRVRLTLEGL